MDKIVKDNKQSVPKKIDTTKHKRFSKIKRRIFKHIWLLRVILIMSAVGILFVLFLGAKAILIKTPVADYVNLAYNFLFIPEGSVRSFDGRTNILILGKGGAGHEAPDLTDTMIFASIDTSQRGFSSLFKKETSPSISLISLPRDIWIPELRAKLNSVYFWGNEKQKDGGALLVSSMVERIIGKSVDYVAVVDFAGFSKIIDEIGGIEVNVDNSFIDNQYPIPGKEADECEADPELKCRYETIVFEKGLQHMDGTTALKFVRSRHAEGDEGNDFARSSRQRKIISAIKDKMLSKEIFYDPRKVLHIWQVASGYIETDISNKEAAALARYAYMAKDEIKSYSLPEELLVVPPLQDRFDNLYVFIPKMTDLEDPSGVSWLEVNEWVDCVFAGQTKCITDENY